MGFGGVGVASQQAAEDLFFHTGDSERKTPMLYVLVRFFFFVLKMLTDALCVFHLLLYVDEEHVCNGSSE